MEFRCKYKSSAVVVSNIKPTQQEFVINGTDVEIRTDNDSIFLFSKKSVDNLFFYVYN